MTVPEVVRERLQDEEPRARVGLGGEDELLVLGDRTLIYRAEGLLSGESVEEYSHDAEQVTISEGRRKSTIRLDHGIDGASEFTIPSSHVADALPPVLGGVLATAGITDPDEAVVAVYRLGELTLVITEARVVKHIGAAVWDQEYEEYEYRDVTDLDVEAGEVSSQIIVEVDGRPQRIKTPSGDAREVRERIQRALFAYHDVDNFAEFKREVAPPEADDTAPTEPSEPTAASQSEPASDPGDRAVEGISVTETPTIDPSSPNPDTSGQPVDVAGEVAALRAAVERQNELLEAHQNTIEQLIEELRRGR